MIDHGFLDGTGRRVTLREVGDENWRAVADIVPLDDQRIYVPAMAARYLLLSMREGIWNSLAVYADDTVVGHVIWGLDEDGSHWIGGMLIDGAEQGKGLGRALLRTMTGWLAEQEDLLDDPAGISAGQRRCRTAVQIAGFRADGSS